jgi:hypothetical protein
LNPGTVTSAPSLPVESYAQIPGAHRSPRVLTIAVPEDLDYEGAFDEVLDRFTTGWELRKVKTADLGSLYELVDAVRMEEATSRKEFLDALRCRNGNLNITLAMGEGSPEGE